MQQRKLIIFFIVFTIIFGQACFLMRSSHKKQQKLFPVELGNVWFGMSKQDFTESRPNAKLSSGTMEFRKVYQEYLEGSPIKKVIFYIDSENTILYEMIIEYKDLETREKQVKELIGNPNHKGSKWKFDSGEGFDIYAWVFQSKLVFAAKIEGTEWEDEDL